MLDFRWKSVWAVWILLAAVLVIPGPAQQSKANVAHAGKASAIRAAHEPAPAVPQAPLQQPATAARISLEHGLLMVEARNSDLSQILQEIARVTGMSVSGLNGGPRVFGVYGPADPRTVLTGLLAASGYNFLLVGGDAMPRELVLTSETKAPPTVARAPKPQQEDEYEQLYAEQESTDPYMR